jgi:molybdopterin synthase sulfur carrier subunit
VRISLRCFADYREIISPREMLLDLKEGQTVGGLLGTITSKYPALRQEMFEETGEIKKHVIVLVAGRNIEVLDHMNTRLKEGDVVALLPHMEGG